MNDRQNALITLLSRSDGWATAAELAERLGVTARSVRSYVSAVNGVAPAREPIESGARGYRLDRAAYSAWHAAAGEEQGGPRARTARLARALIDQAPGIGVSAAAEELHVSESTIEGDLVRLRARLKGTGLALARHGDLAVLEGPETARRRLLGALFREESEHGMLELEAIQREFPTAHLDEFKSALLAAFAERNDVVNEYGLNNVLLHVAIAIDRVTRHGGVIDSPQPTMAGSGELTALLGGLLEQHFGVALQAEDLRYLGFLMASRVITAGQDHRGQGAASATAAGGYLGAADLETMRGILARAAAEYLVELDDEDFLVRLALHVRNLVVRAQHDTFSRNPLTRSIKASYPMIYELAVYIASELQRIEGIHITDDEIAYIAMHVGAQLERRRVHDAVQASVVSPSYQRMHLDFLKRLDERFGSELAVLEVSTRSDVEWNALPGDLVISTLEPARPDERVVVVAPFLTERDEQRIRSALSRARRQRRRADLAAQVLQYFEPSLFLRNVNGLGPEAAIRQLGAAMHALGIVDERYIEGAIERERMSSTAFTESLAVPHAMAMTATRTAIAVMVNETPMAWGDARVQLVALIAFSESGRAGFQGFFDQFVEVFSEREAVTRLVRNALDFPSFIAELVQVMDA